MEDKNQFVRTTIYMPRKLHEAVKMMSILTHSGMSRIMCIALREKLEQLHGKKIEIDDCINRISENE